MRVSLPGALQVFAVKAIDEVKNKQVGLQQGSGGATGMCRLAAYPHIACMQGPAAHVAAAPGDDWCVCMCACVQDACARALLADTCTHGPQGTDPEAAEGHGL